MAPRDETYILDPTGLCTLLAQAYQAHQNRRLSSALVHGVGGRNVAMSAGFAEAMHQVSSTGFAWSPRASALRHFIFRPMVEASQRSPLRPPKISKPTSW
jgi:hypothetical protein